jgi:hypothetical protein
VNTPQGHGYAIFIEGDSQDYYWTIILDSGAPVSFPQEQIMVSRNYTYGRNMTHEEMKAILAKATSKKQGSE